MRGGRTQAALESECLIEDRETVEGVYGIGRLVEIFGSCSWRRHTSVA